MRYLPVIADWWNWSGRLLINHLWQATLFSGLALVATLFLRRAPASARYLIWLAASAKFALPSVLILFALNGFGLNPQSYFPASQENAPTFQYLTPIVSPLVIPAQYLNAANGLSDTAPVHAPLAERRIVNRIYLVLGVVWLAGSGFIFVSWIRRRRRVSAAIRTGHYCESGRERAALTKVTSWLSIRRRVMLVITSEVHEPGVWGVIRPIVLLPKSLGSQLTDEELESLMMHEMAHVLRWDNLVSNLNMILCGLFWFNPIVWLIDRSLLKEREEACDEVVLRWCGSGKAYASGITKIYRACLNSRLSGLSAAAGSNLKRRLERILSDTAENRFRFSHKLLVTAVLLGCIGLSVLAAFSNDELMVAHPSLTFRQAAGRLQASVEQKRTAPCAGTDSNKCGSSTPIAAISQGRLAEVNVVTDAQATTENFEPPTPNSAAPAFRNPVNVIQPKQDPPSTFESAHALDLKKFAGRYGVDPAVMENFIFDVSVGNDELWLQPSHSAKHRLVAVSNIEFADSKSSDTRLTFNFDPTGNVDSFILRGWGPVTTVKRIILPPPSTDGNVTFRLSGHIDAQNVAVAGTFNNWNQSQYMFARVGDEWICRVNLPRGKYQYKFIVDGIWLVDPGNPTIEHDERDFENSVLIVR
ncbi:MAG TPA: M56 family metallopeptidase [Pyrinomonadaceae bacterium]|nr:M56 family metallopeptidase [Pyrinomonadaceae bacterium]